MTTGSPEKKTAQPGGEPAPCCEKCGAGDGRPYTFVFGTSIGGNHSRAGEASAAVCVECIDESRQQQMRKGTIGIVVGLLLLVAGVAVGLLLDVPLVAVLASVAGLVTALVGWASRSAEGRRPASEIGERLAIGVRKGELESQDVNRFWTQKAWRDLAV